MTDRPGSPSSGLEFVRRYQGLLGVLVAASVVRFPGLDDWWLNPDEGIYYSILTRATFAGFWEEVARNAHPPLYYLLLRGVGVLTWDFVWFRVLSVLLGLAAIVGIWAAARKLAGGGARASVAGFLAALMIAFAPGAIELSQVIRPYMLQVTLLSGALLFLLRYLDEARLRDLVGYVTLVLLALLTHYSSLLAFGAFALLALYDAWEQRIGRGGWVERALAHAVPVALFGVVYVMHLRGMMSGPMAADALEGWLGPYMIERPADIWLALLGFQDLAAPTWLQAPAAILLLAALVVPFLRRRPPGSSTSGDRRVAVLAGAGLLAAIAGAAAGLYPFGATRHSAWLLIFTTPALAWLGTWLLTLRGRRATVAAATVLALAAAGGPLGDALGEASAPWAPTDRVLRRSDLMSMVELLDPSGTPELVVMGAETFYLLVPFYPAEREAATFSEDGSLFHFELGERRILVRRTWNFTEQGEASAVEVLARALEDAGTAFPALELADVERAVLLSGGWRAPLVGDLTRGAEEEDFLISRRSVPGLFAFLIDVPRFRTAFASAR